MSIIATTTTSTFALGQPCQRVVEQFPSGAYLAAIYEGTGTGKIVFRRCIDSTWSPACGSSGPNSDGTITAKLVALFREGSDVHILVESTAAQTSLNYIKATWNGTNDWSLGASLSNISTIAGTGSSSISVSKDPELNEYAVVGSVAGVRVYTSYAPEVYWIQDILCSGEEYPTLIGWNGNLYLFTTDAVNRRLRVRKRSLFMWSAPYDVLTNLPAPLAAEYSLAATNTRLHLLYREAGASKDTLVHIHSSNPMAAWSRKNSVGEGPPGTLKYPGLTVAGGDLIATWQVHFAAGQDSIRSAWFRPSGWQTPAVVVPQPGEPNPTTNAHPCLPPTLPPDVAANELIYLQGSASPYNVRAQSFTPGDHVSPYTCASRPRIRRRRRK